MLLGEIAEGALRFLLHVLWEAVFYVAFSATGRGIVYAFTFGRKKVNDDVACGIGVLFWIAIGLLVWLG